MMRIQELCQYFNSLLFQRFNQREIDVFWRILKEDFELDKIIQTTDELKTWKEKIKDIGQRILHGEPIQYITGMEIFYGLKYKVNHHVLIPRPETEELVHWIHKVCMEEKYYKHASIIDIGTGSGCIALSLKYLNRQLNVEAIDLSKLALQVAMDNGLALGLNVDFYEMDFLEKSSWQALKKYDIIVSNPPYIPKNETKLMDDNVLEHEPHLALFVDDDPLIFYRMINEFSKEHLNENGYVFVECNEFNAIDVHSLFANGGFKEVVLKQDMQGKDRMIMAKK